MVPTVLVLNGPNLNLLGTREPEHYGRQTLSDIEATMRAHARSIGFDIDLRQSNHEGELVDWIQAAHESCVAIVINAGALSHTSIAILDALLACRIPIVEVHLSNIFRRESFRHVSYVSQAARGVICGLGSQGYILALDAIANLVNKSDVP
ncbi:MAG TPA: type II 3-dehydroquinate dehydratase [Alphaproteobacteria bacterium]|jgi:3-dehydroquinate dehydratase II|nr:type II 3-dehydroquinate dehydratase [Alphaproteobacteria bacterium]